MTYFKFLSIKTLMQNIDWASIFALNRKRSFSTVCCISLGNLLDSSLLFARTLWSSILCISAGRFIMQLLTDWGLIIVIFMRGQGPQQHSLVFMSFNKLCLYFIICVTIVVICCAVCLDVFMHQVVDPLLFGSYMLYIIMDQTLWINLLQAHWQHINQHIIDQHR